MTMKDLLDRLPKCNTKADALYLTHQARQTFGDNAYGNIRYSIGYFDEATRTKLYQLFDFL